MPALTSMLQQLHAAFTQTCYNHGSRIRHGFITPALRACVVVTFSGLTVRVSRVTSTGRQARCSLPLDRRPRHR